MMMSYDDFFHKYGLKIKATSILKIYQVLHSSDLDKVDIYLREERFSSDVGIFKLHQ